MSAILAIITSRLGLGIICSVLILASVTASYQWGRTHLDKVREEQRADGLHAEIYAPVTGLRDRLSSCTADLGNATASLNRQNAAVDALKAEADARDAKARQAVSAAQDRARTAERRVQGLLQSSPREGETPCVAAERLIREEIR
ncbi:hypothetical protein BBAL3_1233 [Brevundimonas sp. BAL3]|uniref:hypothetical protein n=1 Tax=Brevundimonas sp. BAL3 TaxID=391600 RepID=UPI00017ED898|nr:hypothetical protein [Brevundimonas sp. BAL3]EDX80076.1 hypothetical protein BBAL3_1233 [Brevundimonas sp. BAL3]